MKTFIDLFSGIGGFRIALEKYGLSCVFSCDIDPSVREVYKLNFGETPFGDISSISEKNIPSHDILCAGFPCQPFSIAGKRKGMSVPDGMLFYHIVRIANYHKPKLILLENVKNLLKVQEGKAFQNMQKELRNLGYEVFFKVLNSSHYGIPQSRQRLYIVCLKQEMSLNFEFPPPSLEQIYLENILEKKIDESLIIHRNDINIERIAENRSLKPIRVGFVNKGGQGERIYSPLGHAVTISAFGGGVGARTGLYSTDQGIRRLSINECKKLMGFPENHILSKNLKGYQQLGNAVIPKMISTIYNSIGERL